MKRFFNLFLSISILFFSFSTFAANWYVDNSSNTGDIYTLGSANGSDLAVGSALAPFATLGKAITAASAGDIIYVDAGTYNQNSISVTKSLTFIGAGTGNTIFDHATGGNRFVTISADNVTFKNMRIQQYWSAPVGARVFDIAGRTGIRIENVVIKDNRGISSSGSPSIKITANSSVTITGLLFSCSGQAADFGGAISIANSTLDLSNSAFKEAESFNGGATGGALDISGTSVVTVSNCTFNKCYSGTGGAIAQTNGTLTVTGSCFSENKSLDQNNGSGGGAFMASGGSASFTNCTFTANETTNNFLSNNGSSDGGAVLIKGGTSTFTTCSFNSNNTSDDGEDIYISSGTVNISECRFESVYSGAQVNVYSVGGTVNFSKSGTPTASPAGVALSKPETAGTITTFSQVGTMRTDVGGVTATGWTDNLVTNTTQLDFKSTTSTAVSPVFAITQPSANLIFDLKRGGASSAPKSTVTLEYSTNSGGSWTPISTYVNNTTGYVTQTVNVSALSGLSPIFRFSSLASDALSWVVLDNIYVQQADLSSPLTTASTACISPNNIALCGSVINCVTDANPPIIFACVPDKTITDCSALLDYTAEVSVYDDCSITITQSPAPGTILTNGVHVVTMTVSDQSAVSPNATCTFNVTVSGCAGCSDPGAPTGSATQTFCASSNPTVASLTATLTGTATIIKWYSASSGGTALAAGTALSTGNYYASQTDVTCESASRLAVAVTVTATPTSGSNGSIALCSTGSSVNLFSSLGGSPDVTGSWSGAFVLGGLHLGTFNPTTMTAGVYTYSVTGTGGCVGTNPSSTVTVSITTAPTTGSNGSVALCSTGSSVNLFSSLGGSPDVTGTWSGASVLGGAHLGTFDPTSMTAGVYTYSITGAAGCVGTNPSSTVTVSITTVPTTGTNGSVALCSTGSSVNLFSSLGGSPDVTGTWSGASVLGGGHLGTFNPTSMTAGVYTYSITGAGGCVGTNPSSTVTVSITTAPTTGSNGTIALCSTGTPVNLFSSLGGSPDATGTWSGASVLGGAHLGTFDPTSMTAGVYTYSITGAAGCVGTNPSSTVTVSITTAPTTGSNGTIALCSTGAPVNLFSSLGGFPDATGTWTGASVLAGAHLGTFDPTTMTAGVYTYSITGAAGCVGTNPSSTVTVSITTSPTSGSNGTIALCSTGVPVNLFSSLGGSPDATGAWTGASALGGAHLGTFDPTSMTAGVYTYTVTGAAGCLGTNPSSTVTVSITTAPIAGTNGVVTLCSNALPINLFSSLGGSPDATGAWTGASVLTGAHLGTYDPTIATAGVYTYTITGAAGCLGTNPTATVTVTESATPSLVITNPVAVCFPLTIDITDGSVTAGSTNLGVTTYWQDNLATLSEATPNAIALVGTNTYYIKSVLGACSDIKPVTVIINNCACPLNLVITDPTPICSPGTVDLTAPAITAGSTGGGALTYFTDATLTLPLASPSAISAIGIHTYYIKADNGVCNDSKSVTVEISQLPNSGVNSIISLCSSGIPVNLLNSLGGSPDNGGMWVGPSALGGGDLGTFDPSTMIAGVYTYSLFGGAFCIDPSSTVTVSITSSPISGTNGNVSLCSTGSSVNLFASLGGSPDITGTWSGPSVLGGGNLGTFNPATMTAGIYTYTVNGVSGCLGTNASSTVTVSITTAPSSGTNGSITFCSTGLPVNLISSLGGSPDATGTWSGPSVLGGAHLGTFDPTTMSIGTYTYSVTGTGGCLLTTVSSNVIVSITQAPLAGTNGSIDLCSTGGLVNLYNSIIGIADNTGTWTGPSVLVGGYLGTFNPTSQSAGTYTYTVNGSGGCIGSTVTSDVVVTITSSPKSGNNGSLTLCSTGLPVNLFNSLTGSPDATGTWSGTSVLGGAHLGTFNPASMTAGIYNYAVNGTGGCTGINPVSSVTVSITTIPNSGTNGNVTICSSGNPINLISSLGGSPDITGTWSGVSVLGGAHLGIFNPSSMTAGVYTYTIIGSAGCIGTNPSSTVTVSITPSANAGNNGNKTVCSSGLQVDLFTSLGGSPDITGTWSGPSVLTGGNLGTFDPATMLGGIYSYTVNGVAGCLGTNLTATVNVTITNSPVAGVNGNITVCSSGNPVNLFNSLGGSPDNTGTWSGASVLGGAHLGIFNPTSMTAGVYTYTVNGTAGCLGVNTSSTVTVSITLAPVVGTNGSTTLCSTGNQVNLFSSLGGNPDLTGTWTGASVLGGGHLGTFDPSTMTAGTYTYTVNGVSGCLGTNLTSNVVVLITTSPVSGINGNASICSTGGTDNLFNSLTGSPDNSGVWTGISSLGGGYLGTFNPLTMTAGIYTYTVNGTAGCLGTNSSSTVTVSLTQPNAPTGDGQQYFCILPTEATVGNLTANGNSINWYSASIGGNQFDPASTLEDNTHYYATQTDVSGCESLARLDVLVHLSSLVAVEKSVTKPYCGHSDGNIVVTASNGIGNYTYVWNEGTSNDTISKIGIGSYTVIVTDSVGCTSKLTFEISCKHGDIPQVISANGNGKNETWVIHADPKASVEIYNRWGSLVYSALPYNDDWNGQTNVGSTLGNQGLPSGTYFYMIDNKDGEKPVSGYIELIK